MRFSNYRSGEWLPISEDRDVKPSPNSNSDSLECNDYYDYTCSSEDSYQPIEIFVSEEMPSSSGEESSSNQGNKNNSTDLSRLMQLAELASPNISHSYPIDIPSNANRIDMSSSVDSENERFNQWFEEVKMSIESGNGNITTYGVNAHTY